MMMTMQRQLMGSQKLAGLPGPPPHIVRRLAPARKQPIAGVPQAGRRNDAKPANNGVDPDDSEPSTKPQSKPRSIRSANSKPKQDSSLKPKTAQAQVQQPAAGSHRPAEPEAPEVHASKDPPNASSASSKKRTVKKNQPGAAVKTEDTAAADAGSNGDSSAQPGAKPTRGLGRAGMAPKKRREEQLQQKSSYRDEYSGIIPDDAFVIQVPSNICRSTHLVFLQPERPAATYYYVIITQKKQGRHIGLFNNSRDLEQFTGTAPEDASVKAYKSHSEALRVCLHAILEPDTSRLELPAVLSDLLQIEATTIVLAPTGDKPVEKWYAVHAGFRRGIFTSWKACERRTAGYSRSMYQGFDLPMGCVDFMEISNEPCSVGTVADLPPHIVMYQAPNHMLYSLDKYLLEAPGPAGSNKFYAVAAPGKPEGLAGVFTSVDSLAKYAKLAVKDLAKSSAGSNGTAANRVFGEYDLAVGFLVAEASKDANGDQLADRMEVQKLHENLVELVDGLQEPVVVIRGRQPWWHNTKAMYAVLKGARRGVCDNWADCRAVVAGTKYKKVKGRTIIKDAVQALSKEI